MRKALPFMAPAIAFGLAVPAPAAPATPAAESAALQPEALLPPGSLFYASVPLSEEYLERLEATAVGEIAGDEEVRRFLEKPLRKLRASLDTWCGIRARRRGVDPRAFLDRLPDRAVFAVLDWDAEREQPAGFFVGLRFRVGEAPARELVAKLLSLTREDAEPARTEYEHAGAKVTRLAWKRKLYGRSPEAPELQRKWTRPAEPLSEEDVERLAREAFEKVKREQARRPIRIETLAVEYTFRSAWLLVVYGEGPEGKGKADMRGLLDRTGGLAESASFRLARERLRFDGSEPFAFFQLGPLLAEARRRLAEERKARPGAMASDRELVDVLDALGLGGIRSASWTQRIEGKAIRDALFIEAPAPRKGLLAALEAGEARGELARFLPADAQMYQEYAVGWDRIWQIVRDTVKAVGDERAVKAFEKAVAEADRTLGFSLEKDLLPCLGTHAAYAGTVGRLPAGVGKTMLVVEVADGKKLADLLAKVLAIPQVEERTVVTRGEHEGVRMTHITLRNLPLPLIPSYAIAEGHLLLAESPPTLMGMIECLRGKAATLAEADGFGKHRDAAFGEGAILGGWYDLKAIVGAAYGAVAPMLSLVMANAPEWRKAIDGAGIDLALLPSPRAITGPLFAGTETLRVDDAGFTYDGRSPVGGPVLGVYKVTLGIAGAVGLGMAIERDIASDREAICRGNLAAIRDAIAVYRATTGGGSPPRDLLDLLRSGALEDPSSLRCPADEKPQKVVDPATGRRIEVSYRYLPENYGAGGKPRKVVFEEDPGRHGNASLVLLGDGRIERIRKGESEP